MNKRTLRFLQGAVLTLLLCALANCGTDEIRASDYATTCDIDEDCVVVREGQCGECGHPRSPAAINLRDRDRYARDYEDLDCPGDDDLVCDLEATLYSAVCEDGVCVAQRADD